MDQAAKRALLDEYRRAIDQLAVTISSLATSQLTQVIDQATKDTDCRSIQTILAHVVHSGYGYTVYIENFIGLPTTRPKKTLLDTSEQYIAQLYAMFAYCEACFAANPTLKLEEYNPAKKIKTNWGQVYDIDQLMEHAIVHILRHRRQIETFVLKQKQVA
jgi:uncharacterized damage-inducible protein DinB